MEQITTIGLDLAKQVFQVHAADAGGVPIFNRKLRRAEVLRFFEKTPACLVGMEACGSAHYWAREISALGHDVRLIPPVYVKPFVKRGKTDAADAEAISEAVTRKTMRFVPVKSAVQQAAAVVLKTRALLVNQRTQVINALRAHLSEFGIIAATGLRRQRPGRPRLGKSIPWPDDVWRRAGRQVFVPSQQLLVHRSRHVGQDARPIHNRLLLRPSITWSRASWKIVPGHRTNR